MDVLITGPECVREDTPSQVIKWYQHLLFLKAAVLMFGIVIL